MQQVSVLHVYNITCIPSFLIYSIYTTVYMHHACSCLFYLFCAYTHTYNGLLCYPATRRGLSCVISHLVISKRGFNVTILNILHYISIPVHPTTLTNHPSTMCYFNSSLKTYNNAQLHIFISNTYDMWPTSSALLPHDYSIINFNSSVNRMAAGSRLPRSSHGIFSLSLTFQTHLI